MKNRLYLLFPIAIALFINGCMAGSDSVIVAGQVIESGSGNAISNAIVELTQPENLQQTATTDSAGNFSFDVDPGSETVSVTLEISKQSYQAQTTNFKLAPETDIDDLVIELQSNDSSDSGGNDGGSDEDDTVEGQSGPPNSLELVGISSSSIAIRGTGGDETSKFTFSVTDTAGRPVDQGHEVDFSIIEGPGGGELINPSTGFTNSSGTVSSAIASGDSAGVIKIRASINEDVQSTPVLVAVGNGFPESENFRIAPVRQNMEAWGLIASSQSTVESNLVVATLGDYRNNPVLPGTAVDFTTTAGIIQANAITDDDGLAIAELRPDGSTPTGHSRGIAFATVTARTIDINDDYIIDDVDVLFTSRDPSIQLLDPSTGDPATVAIPQNGSQNFDLVIMDVNGYPVAAGSEIEVESSQGTSNNFGGITLGDFTAPGAGRTEFGFTVSDSDDTESTEQNATITVTVTLPSGDTKRVTF